MTDIGLSLLVTRDLLGLPSLELNDHVKFVVGANLLGSQVSWERQTATSPWVEGEVTVNRRRGLVRENVEVWVLGDTYATMQTNLTELIAAFSQDRFSLQLTLGSAPAQSWFAETSDYQVQFNNVSIVGQKMLVRFQVPRQPVPAAGGF